MQNSRVYKIPSHTSPDTVYNVRLSPDFCECKGFHHRGQCTHIDEAKELAPLIDEAEELGMSIFFCTICGRLLNPQIERTEAEPCQDCRRKRNAKAGTAVNPF